MDNKLTVFDKKSEKFIKHINIPLCEPRGLAVTPDNYIIVADDHKIRKIDIDGKCIASVGKYGDKKGEFKYVGSVTISPDNQYLYVTDYENDRIQILNASNFDFIEDIRDHKEDIHDHEEDIHDHEGDLINRPTHTAIDGKQLYVCNSRGHNIQQYSFADHEWEPTKKFENKHLNQPFRMAIREGILYVTDRINNCIVMFTTDGEFVGYYGKELFNRPSGILFDYEEDKLYICDDYNNRIIVIH